MMDMDSPPEAIPESRHANARNIRWLGDPDNLRAEVLAGNTLIVNPFLPVSGVGCEIGRFYDANKQRLFLFLFNSLGNHGVYIYYTRLGNFARLVQDGINTSGNVLGFTATGTITSINIIYGDNNSGDLLFFVDSLGRPTKINIDRFLGSPGFTPYNPIKRAFIDVIKAPPVMPPQCTYEHDTTVNVNNLTNSIFKFAEQFIYDDYERSVKSSASIVPLPTATFSNTQNVDKSKNARIAVYLQTGDVNVTEIRLLMQQTQNGTISDWLIVDTINKSAGNIANNSVYRYEFFNGGNYVGADINEMDLDFDYVPPVVTCQELPAGNVVAYGNVTEGYPYFSSKFSEILLGNTNSDGVYNGNGFLFFAATNGLFSGSQPQIVVYLTGAGTNDVNGNPQTLDYAPTNTFVNVNSNGLTVGFSATSGSTNIPVILAALEADAVAGGWVIVSTGTNSFVCYYPTGTVILQSSYTRSVNPIINGGFQFALYPESAYAYGIVYRDAAGRTNGVITDISANITTLTYSALGFPTYTEVKINLNGITPPSWAAYYGVVRTNTLTFNKHFDWVTNQAFSNVGTLVENQYAFLGIGNILDYNESLQASEGVTIAPATSPVGGVSYDFAQGDRVRIRARYSFNGLYYPLSFDYPILGVVQNPIINGTPQVGNFIQIAYPAADIAANPNFNFINSVNAANYADFQMYQILVYSITTSAQPETENTGSTAPQGNVFYEFGKQFGIGNPGTINAYHMGNIAANQVGFSDGDVFMRQRVVPCGATYYITVNAANFSNRYATPAIPLTTITTSVYTIGPQNANAASIVGGSYPNITDTGFFYQNTSGVTETIRLRGTLAVGATGPSFSDIYAKVVFAAGPNGATAQPLVVQSAPVIQAPASPIQVSFDSTFGVPSGAKIWFIYGNGTQVNNINYYPFQLRIDVQQNIPITVFDPSFTDIYSLQTNSDNRPNLQNTEALTTNFDTVMRFGQAYQPGTNINNTNRFYPNDFVEFNKSYGPLQRLKARDRELRFFQYRKIGVTGIYSKFIADQQGNPVLIVTDKIITPNNVRYYQGNFGLTDPNALVSSQFVDYIADSVSGSLVRLSDDGNIDISMLYKVKIFTGENLPNYLGQWNYQFGGNAKILGTFYQYKDKPAEYICLLQGGTNGNKSIPGQAIAFDESRNAFTSFWDLNCDGIICCENDLYFTYNGNLYIHNNTTNYANFFGVQYYPSITLVFNKNVAIKKKFQSLSYQAQGQIWDAATVGDITTSFINPQTGFQQISQLLAATDFDVFEGNTYAAFLYDGNSMSSQQLAIVEGDYLEGVWLKIKLTYKNSNFTTFYSPYILWLPSGRNF